MTVHGRGFHMRHSPFKKAAPATLLAQMPATPLGLWQMGDYSTSGARPLVPNVIDTAPAKSSLIGPGRRVFGNNQFWTFASASISDSAATAPDSSSDASVLTAAGGNWYFGPTGATGGIATYLPNGTYTIGLNVRWRGTGATGFKLGNYPTMSSFTATASWQRFSVQVTISAGVAYLIMQTPDGTSAANLEICDFDVFSGSTDFGPQLVSSAIYFHKTTSGSAAPSAPTNGVLDVGNAANAPFIQFPGTALTGAFTMIWNAKTTSTGFNSGYQPVLSILSTSYSTFMAGVQAASFVGQYNGTFLSSTGTDDAVGAQLDSVGRNINTVVVTYDLTTLKVYSGGQLIYANAQTISAINLRDFYFNVLNQTYYSGMQYGLLGLYARALTGTEAATASTAVANYCAGKGAAQEPTRFVMFEGDSITGLGTAGAGGAPKYSQLVAKNASPIIRMANLAVSGNVLANLVSRASTVDAYLPASKNGRQFIFHCLIGSNNVNAFAIPDATLSADVSAFLSSLQTYLTARRTAGWDKIVLGTLLDRTSGTDGGTQFESAQATINTTIRGWVGTVIDACSDFAANTNLGAVAAANNTTYFGDKIHPTAAGYALMDPVARAAINPLWTY